ncbi:MAG: cytochrome c-type biogenesis protein CcmH [Vicinamibacterales bacterium]
MPVRLRSACVAAALAAALVAVSDHADAQVPPRQQATDLASQLMSPFCPGRLLVDCTSSQAYDLRETIAARLAAGESVDAVRADLVQRYGHEILGAPPAAGIGLLAWWLPALVGVLTLGGVARKVATAAHASPSGRPLAAMPAGEARWIERLDDELRDLD